MNLGPSFLLVGLGTFVHQHLADLDSAGRRFGFAPSQFLLDFPAQILLRYLAGLGQLGCTNEMLPVLVALVRSAQATKQSQVVCASMLHKFGPGTPPGDFPRNAAVLVIT